MNVQCPSCQAQLDAEPDWVGQTVECPQCGAPVEVTPPQRTSRRSVVIAPTITPVPGTDLAEAEYDGDDPDLANEPPAAAGGGMAAGATGAEAEAAADLQDFSAQAGYSRGTLAIAGSICLGVGFLIAMGIFQFLLKPDPSASSSEDPAALEELNKVKGLLLEQDTEIEALKEQLVASERAAFVAKKDAAQSPSAPASSGQRPGGPVTLDRIEAELTTLGFKVPDEGDFYRGATKNSQPLPRPYGSPQRAGAGSSGHYVYDIPASQPNQAALRVIFERGRYLLFIPAAHNPGLPRDLLRRLGISDDPAAVLSAAERQWKILHDVRVYSSAKGTSLASDELPTLDPSYEVLFGIMP